MSIPDYQSLMLPLLNYLDDGKEHRWPDAVKAMAEIGVDISDRQPALLDDVATDGIDVVITVCESAARRLPSLPRTHRHPMTSRKSAPRVA